MLPFRSGRAGIVSAASALSLVVLLSCAVFAAEKKTPKAQAKAPSPAASAAANKKQRPKPAEGIQDVPITEGHDAKGLVLPDFDVAGHLRGKLHAGVTRRLDAQNVEFQGVKFTTFQPESEATDLEITVDKAVFNLKTQVLTSSVRSTVKRADFEVAGDTMRFEMVSRLGTLEGNVKMVVHGKSRTPGEQPE